MSIKFPDQILLDVDRTDIEQPGQGPVLVHTAQRTQPLIPYIPHGLKLIYEAHSGHSLIRLAILADLASWPAVTGEPLPELAKTNPASWGKFVQDSKKHQAFGSFPVTYGHFQPDTNMTFLAQTRYNQNTPLQPQRILLSRL